MERLKLKKGNKFLDKGIYAHTLIYPSDFSGNEIDVKFLYGNNNYSKELTVSKKELEEIISAKVYALNIYS